MWFWLFKNWACSWISVSRVSVTLWSHLVIYFQLFCLELALLYSRPLVLLWCRLMLQIAPGSSSLKKGGKSYFPHRWAIFRRTMCVSGCFFFFNGTFSDIFQQWEQVGLAVKNNWGYIINERLENVSFILCLIE